MKIFSRFFKIKLLLIFLLLCQASVFSQSETPFSINESPLPPPTAPVNDFAGVMDEATKQRLNQRIKDFKAKTNPPVVLAVAIVKTTGDRPIFDYSLAVFRGWKIGTNQGDNPGALLFIAVDDRKYFTQVSRDLEDELPDGLVGQLQRQYLVPALKQGDYNKGVSETIEAYIRTIEERTSGGTTPAPTNGQTEQTKEQPGIPSISRTVCCLALLVILLIVIFSRSGSSGGRNKNDRDRWGGGGGGFGGGGGALPWIIGSIIANSGSSSNSSGWGGSGDWGGGSSGSGDWGGFGGGGDAGGGGAGGDW